MDFEKCLDHELLIYSMRQEKGTTFFVNKSFNMQCNLTKFSTLNVNEHYHRCYLFNFWNLHLLSVFVDSDIKYFTSQVMKLMITG